MKLALLMLALLGACATSQSVQLFHRDGRSVRCTTTNSDTLEDGAYQRCLRRARKRGFRPAGSQTARYWYQLGRRPCYVYDSARACEDAVRKLRALVGRDYVTGCFVRQGPRPICKH